MERIMSKTMFEDRTLADSELDAVSGGSAENVPPGNHHPSRPYNSDAMYAWDILCVQLFRQTF
jgi:hypothetical protein